jgi:hypothetical protein
MSPMLVCHSLFNESGPGVPATSLLTPLRAASCSAIGQSSNEVGAVDVGLGDGDGAVVGVADAVGFGEALGTSEGVAEADADGDALPEDVGCADGVAEADVDAVGDANGALELITGGVPPWPLHAQKAAAATNAIRPAREKRGKQDLS